MPLELDETGLGTGTVAIKLGYSPNYLFGDLDTKKN